MADLPLYPTDARLEEIAAEMAETQAAIHAHNGDDSEFNVLLNHLDELSGEIDRIPASTFAGVLHKLRVTNLPTVSDDGNAHDLMVSICEDITRLHETGGLHG